MFITRHDPFKLCLTFGVHITPKGEDPGTKAIATGTDDGGKEVLNVAWAEGEQVAIYYQKTDDTYATATATVGTPNPDGSAPITATLTDAKGGTAKFVFPATLANTTGDIDEEKLLNQNGNLTGANGISTLFDAAIGSGTITVSGTEALVSGTVSLTNQVCICKFRFNIVENYGMGGSPRDFSTPVIINDGNGHIYTITSDRTNEMYGGTRGFNSTDDIYVALLPVSGGIVTFSTTYGTNDYSYRVTNTTLAVGKFYRNLSINMVKGGYTNHLGYSQYYTSTVTIPAGGTLTLDNVLIEVSNGPAIECEGDATIILSGANRVTSSAEGKAAIFIPEGKTLTIQGTGSLTAESTREGGAGIGGGYQGGYSYAGINCGNIVIESGTVTATGEDAGIGSGAHGNCGTITINGGTVTATGKCAAGIGSGFNGTCGAITINGGTITATGDSNAAGIGSGVKGTCGDITVNGGTITANGGRYAASIGSGTDGTCGAITIGSGLASLTATMGYEAKAPIGSGDGGSCGTVTIDGSTTWTAGTETTNYIWTVSTVKDSWNEDVTRWTLTRK